MREGWNKDQYFVFFEGNEIATATHGYGIPEYLPNYLVIGLRDWGDFIVQDAQGKIFTIPTVPLSSEHLKTFSVDSASAELSPDNRFTDKIKWYVKPLIFGGDPQVGPNMAWISHQDHQIAVKYWNDLYRQIKQRSKSA